MSWIKVTTSNGAVRWVNMDAVNEMFERNDGMTVLCMPHEDFTEVKETPEQILVLLRQALDEC